MRYGRGRRRTGMLSRTGKGGGGWSDPAGRCIPPDASCAPHSAPSPPPPDLVLQSPDAGRL